MVRTASFRGITEDTIRIGAEFWDTSLFGFGFFGDPELVWDALIGAANANGGVHTCRSKWPTRGSTAW